MAMFNSIKSDNKVLFSGKRMFETYFTCNGHKYNLTLTIPRPICILQLIGGATLYHHQNGFKRTAPNRLRGGG